ncbi:putative disease resistance protein RGA3 [Triticum dicoccoides]|uniref:putative disease resistance protein RGA3 n=1 Tax=Triticum dicoccoides TaxID=85692 RepID=UPI001891002C|nr:putative disease resistance protein RGA3 [Triticum dicoccoides]
MHTSLLDHNNNENNNIMVLPIVGMGGTGKTTLAQLVHNDETVKHHFELVIWVCVSDKFVFEEIIRSIIQVVTLNKCELTEMEALQKKLGEVLGKKMCLLVLDDVWNEDRQKWDDMRSLLCSHVVSSSAIIVTSRSDQVASIMGTHPPHQISLLNEDQSWELFNRNTFGRGVEKQDEFISMAKSIVHKCKGLPLAIKTIPALLRSKNHSHWFSIVDSDVWKSDILATGIAPALHLSYDHLSSEEKICFSLCAILPKDRLMDKDMLIQLWMANDLIASETRGQQIFDVQESLQGSTYASSLEHEVRYLSLDHVSNDTIATTKEMLAPRPRTILVHHSECMPQGIGKLNSLQTLMTYVIDSEEGRGIDQLKDLNLGGGLSLTELRKVHSAESAKQGNIFAKHNLKRLALDWGGPFIRRDGDEVGTDAEGILEALRPHKTLEGLLLRCSTIVAAALSRVLAFVWFG